MGASVSFKCDFCGKTAPPRTQARMVPLLTRDKWRKGQEGSEIVREGKMCAQCWAEGDR